jgi:hypothetical protein
MVMSLGRMNVRKSHLSIVPKSSTDFFEAKTCCLRRVSRLQIRTLARDSDLWENERNGSGSGHADTDEDQVVLPPDLFEGQWGRTVICHCREEEGDHADRCALTSEMRRPDLRIVDVGGAVDGRGEAEHEDEDESDRAVESSFIGCVDVVALQDRLDDEGSRAEIPTDNYICFLDVYHLVMMWEAYQGA